MIALRPFPETGGRVYDRTNRALAEILGRERYAAFQQLAVTDFESRMERFGVAERKVTFTYEPAASDGRAFVVRDEQRYPNGNSNSTRRARDREELEQFVTAARLLPSEFFDRK